MMEHFETIKLAIDVLLVLGVVALVVGAGKGSKGINTGRMTEIAGMLKALVKEADNSGRNLNEQLMKRRAEMEKLLYEIESVEHKINSAITTAEEQRSLLEIDTQRFEQRAEAARASVPRHAPAVHQAVREEEPTPRYAPIEEEAPAQQEQARSYTQAYSGAYEQSMSYDEPAALQPETSYSSSYQEAYPSAGGYQPSAAPKPVEPAEMIAEPASFGNTTHSYAPAAAKRWGKTNIFGDSIDHDESRLLEQVETSQEASQYQSGFSEAMQDIYEVAENLLKAGVDIRSVAARTKLPADEVQMLARVVKQESAAAQTAAQDEAVSEDPRLGVLGGLSRTRQTL